LLTPFIISRSELPSLAFITSDSVCDQTKNFLVYLHRLASRLDPDFATDSTTTTDCINEGTVKILLLAHFLAVYHDSFFKTITPLSENLYYASHRLATTFDCITSSVVNKTPVSIKDVRVLFDSAREHSQAYSNWRAEDKECLSITAQQILGTYTRAVDTLPHHEIIEGSPRVDGMCTSICNLVYEAYHSTGAPAMIGPIELVKGSKKLYPTLTFPPLGYTKDSFGINSIVERGTPRVEDGVFSIDINADDRQTMPVESPLTLIACQGALVLCYVNAHISGAPDSLSIMVLHFLARNILDDPLLVPWARAFHEQMEEDLIAEIRDGRFSDAYEKHRIIIGAKNAPPCCSPRALSE
jgi:hypothetical protein